MTLTLGTRLGPYEILSPLSAGGMGEVIRAKDTCLDRTVAFKVLPTHLSSDPELKQRMEREGKAISALQHANICTLHDIGSQNGTNFLVMEYLEGQILAIRFAFDQQVVQEPSSGAEKVMITEQNSYHQPAWTLTESTSPTVGAMERRWFLSGWCLSTATPNPSP
jgi:serine/threonine protein kinase